MVGGQVNPLKSIIIDNNNSNANNNNTNDNSNNKWGTKIWGLQSRIYETKPLDLKNP